MGQQDLKVGSSGQFAPRVLHVRQSFCRAMLSSLRTESFYPLLFRFWTPMLFISLDPIPFRFFFKLKRTKKTARKTFSESRGQRNWKKVNSTQPPTSNKIMILYVDFALYWFHWSRLCWSRSKKGRTLNPQWIIMESFSDWFSLFSRLSTSVPLRYMHGCSKLLSPLSLPSNHSLSTRSYATRSKEERSPLSMTIEKEIEKSVEKKRPFCIGHLYPHQVSSSHGISSFFRSKWHGRRWWGCQEDVGWRTGNETPFT